MTVLLGGIAYDVPIQGTADLYYLSDSMGAYDIDYAPSSSGFWLEPYEPYASLVPITLVEGTEASGKNLPTTVTTFSVNSGHKIASYLEDFYYRVHTSIHSLALGNVLSEQIFTIEIWNAWFSNTDMDSLVNTNLSDIVFDLPVTLPSTFTPLEFINGTITVSITGVPIIDGFYTLTFDTSAAVDQVIVIPVTGRRVFLWPFAPQTLSGRREWLTDVIPSRHGEQRFNLREYPRELLSVNYLFRDVKEYSLAKLIGDTNAHLALATPLWPEAIQVGNLVIGQLDVYFTTANMELTTNSIIVFWSNYNDYEVAEVDTVYADHVTLRQALKTNRRKSWAMSVYIGYLPNGVNLNRSENKKFTASIDFNIIQTYNLPIWPNGITYLGLPVITDPSVVSGGLSERFSRDVGVFDSETGNVLTYDIDDYNRGNQLLSMKSESKAQLYALRRQFDYLKGKYNAFWLPSFNTDLRAVTGLNSGATTIKVVSGEWAYHDLNHIRIIGTTGTISYFQVTGATDNFDGTEDLALSPAAPVTISSIKRIEIVTKMRLNTDSIEFSRNNTRITTVKASCIEVLS